MKLQFPSTLCLSKNQAPCHCFVWTPKKIICGSFISKNMQKPMLIQLFSKKLCPSINVIIQRTSDIHVKLLHWTIQYSTQTNTCQTTPLDNVTLDQSAYTSVSNYIHVYKKISIPSPPPSTVFQQNTQDTDQTHHSFQAKPTMQISQATREAGGLDCFTSTIIEVFPVFTNQNSFTTQAQTSGYSLGSQLKKTLYSPFSLIPWHMKFLLNKKELALNNYSRIYITKIQQILTKYMHIQYKHPVVKNLCTVRSMYLDRV